MKKTLTILAAFALFHSSLKAQLTVTKIDEIDTAYSDMKQLPTGEVVGLRYGGNNYLLDLLPLSSTGFGGPLQSTIISAMSDYLLQDGGVVYPYNYELQAVDFSVPATPLVYPVVGLHPTVFDAELWDDLLFTLNNVDGFSYRLHIYSVADPSAIVQVDSVAMPAESSIHVVGDKLYCFVAGQLNGNRIRRYQLQAGAPYVTLLDSLVVNTTSAIAIPVMDAWGSHLFAQSNDSLYRFSLDANGALTLSDRKYVPSQSTNMLALDSNTICYAGYQTMIAYSLTTGIMMTFDSAQGFNNFRKIGKLGGDVFYTDYLKTYLVRITNSSNSVGEVVGDVRVDVSPNPATT